MVAVEDSREQAPSVAWRAAVTPWLLAWGIFAFGAVYPWAFVPLFAGCFAIGMAALAVRTSHRTSDAMLVASLALVSVTIAIQLIPLPVAFLRRVTPATDELLRQYTIGYATPGQHHALSIEPSATVLALAGGIALSIFFLGLMRTLTRSDTIHVVRAVVVIGSVLALAGIVQKALWNGKLYGFWTPFQAGESFGPFVNRNHFAGAMLMALPVGIGYFCARVVRGMRDVKPGWRNRLVWSSSAEASETVLIGFAVLLMALALMLSMSRSGILGLVVALALSACFVLRRQTIGTRRHVAAAYLAFVLVAVVAWTGLDRLATRFFEADAVSVQGRVAIWRDTWAVFRRFPIAGTGLNTFGTATVFYQTADRTKHFFEAHNDYLQLLAEGGLLVCIPIALATVAYVRTARQRLRHIPADSTDYWIRIGALTGVAAVAVQELVDFSLQMPGNAVLFVVLLAVAVRHSTGRRRISI